MTQLLRTSVYAILGVAALLVAWLAAPATIRYEVHDDTGERFFAAFDPLDARSLEVVSINPETMARRAFKVAQQNGVWVIPSREGYPADAQEHLARAAASVMDVRKGTIVSDSPADHELFGVTDPTGSSAPSLGAGTRVTLHDGAGRTLVDLIIGKPVKDKHDWRYVRVPGRDRVYAAAVSTDALSTRFEDWIERDLLKLDSHQMKEVVLDDYALDPAAQRIVRGERLVMQRDPQTRRWSIDTLKETETLNEPPLEEMLIALDNLQIVDVHRKPAGLSSQLQTESGLQIDAEAMISLTNRGYYIVGGRLLSNKGDVLVRTVEGVEYILRFGEMAVYDAGAALGGDGDESPGAAGDSAAEQGRYLFVTARFDAALISESESEGEREQKIAAGQEKVRMLNARFADWYYVVPDSVYRQVRLQRSDIISGGE